MSMSSPEDIKLNGKYSNGQKCNSTLNRCGSFQEGGGAKSVIRRSESFCDIPPISKVLCLEPISIKDHQCKHLSKAKKALGIAVDGYFAPVPSKIEGLKASIHDCSIHARERVKKYDEKLSEVSKYMIQLKAIRSRKNGESNNLKMSIHYPPTPDIGSQKSKERTKDTNLNKRARSSMVETRGKGLIREDDRADDPKKGECGEKKMKRKRSYGAAFNSSSPDAHKLRSSINEESLPKAKPSRTSRAASVMANAASSSCEASEPVSLINRKRSAPSNSPRRIVKWGDHRANKISRTRRTSVVSPMPVESADVTSSEAERHLKGKPGISSPLTCYEESVDVVEPKKNKPVGIRRHGRNTRSAASPKTSLAPETKPKKAVSKPTKGSRISEVKGKPGRPPKKIVDRKSAASPGQSLMSSPINSPTESEDDWEELLAATTEATCHLDSISTGIFWKKCRDVFGPISSDVLSFLKQQLNQEEEHQVDVPRTSKALSSDKDPSNEQTKGHSGHPNEGHDKINHLYQRVLSALIIEDDYKDSDNGQTFPVHSPVSDGIDLSYHSNVDNKALMMELQILGLAPEPVPDLDDNETDSLDREIAELTKNINQLRQKKKTCFRALYEAAEEDAKLETGRVEKRAMDNLVEIAVKKHLVPKAAKSFKRAARGFIRRTNLRCRLFEETGDCSFLKSAFLHTQDPALASETAPENDKVLEVPLNFATGKRTERVKQKMAVSKSTRMSKSKDKPESPSPERTVNSNVDKEVVNMSDLQALDMELGAANQDLGNWLDVEGLPDADFSLDGLDIPMDDLADLGMF